MKYDDWMKEKFGDLSCHNYEFGQQIWNAAQKELLKDGIRVRVYGISEPWRFFKTCERRAQATVILD